MRLSTFARVCSRLCTCLRLSTFVSVCWRLLAFAYAPLFAPPPLRDFEKRPKHKPCETKARFFPPLLPVGSQELVLKVPQRGQFHRCDSCDNKTPRFFWPRSTRETDGIAAKLLRCGIASEALRRNMPLRQSFETPTQHISFLGRPTREGQLVLDLKQRGFRAGAEGDCCNELLSLRDCYPSERLRLVKTK